MQRKMTHGAPIDVTSTGDRPRVVHHRRLPRPDTMEELRQAEAGLDQLTSCPSSC